MRIAIGMGVGMQRRASAPVPSGDIQFGEVTAVGAGGTTIAEADGTYGQFTVLAGEITPNTSPLTVGTTTVGTTTVEVIAGVAHAKSLTELFNAMEAARPAGGRTIRLRGIEMEGGTLDSSGTVTPVFGVQLVIDSEVGHKFTSPLSFRHWRNFKIDGVEVHDVAGNPAANVLTFIGDCGDYIVDRCHIHGAFRDPLADYSDGSYSNTDVGIRTASSGRGGPVGESRIWRTLIEDVKTATTMGIGSGGHLAWFNEVRRVYADGMKGATGPGTGLDAPISFRYNYMYDAIGNPTNIDNPHVDWIQIISGDNRSYTGYEAIGNVTGVTNTAAGVDLQGITSFTDVGNRNVFVNPVIAGNIIAKASNHNVGDMLVNGAIAHYNTIVVESPDVSQPTFQSILFESAGTNPISIKGNLMKTGTAVTGVATDVFKSQNRQFDVSAYNLFMAGPNFLSNVWAEFIASYAPKAGGPGVGFGAHEIMTFGTPRSTDGWAVDETKLVPLSAASVPDTFYSLQWSVVDAEVGGRLDVTISALPDDGGSALTDLEYRLNGGAWVSFGSALVGSYQITGLTNDVSVNVEIRAVNAIGGGAASDTKTGTPTLNVANSIVFLDAASSTGGAAVTVPAHAAGDILIVGAHQNAAGNMGNLTDMTGWTMLGANAAYLVGFYQVSDGSITSVDHPTAEGMTVAIYRPTTGAVSIGAVAELTGNSAESTVPALSLLDTDGSSYVTSLRTHRGSFTTDVYAPTLTQRTTSNYRASARGSIQDTNGGVASFSSVSGTESGSNNWRTIAVELRSV